MSVIARDLFQDRNDPSVVVREYPLIFDSFVPGAVVARAIALFNDEVGALPGVAYFPEITRREELFGELVQVSYLHADEIAWDAFQARSESYRPRAERRFESENEDAISPVSLYASAK